MRGLASVTVLVLFLGAVVVTRARTPSVTAQAEAAASAGGPNQRPPTGTLNDLMRGIYFPSSNLIFDVQLNDPSIPKTASDQPGSAAAFASLYARWDELEYAAVALTDGVDLLLTPGRLCQNGVPVPVARPDYRRFAEAMRSVGRATLAAVKSRDREKVIDATNDLAETCMNCHQVYRRGNPDNVNRCVAPTR